MALPIFERRTNANPGNVASHSFNHTVGTQTATADTLPGTGANSNAVGSIAWSNPGNVTASDNTRATFTASGVTATNYLKATNFGFAIPAGAQIKGITVKIERVRSGGSTGNINDSEVKIVKADGSVGTTNKASATNWPTSEGVATYGGASDLWGETWTPADINDADFGVVLSAKGAAAGSNRIGEVDSVTIAVTYATDIDNPLLVVIVATDNSTSAVNSITYGGVALTKVDTSSRVTFCEIDIWYLAAPPGGTNAVLVTMSGSIDILITASSYTGADQSSPFHLSAKANGSSGAPSVNLTTTAADTIIVDGVSTEDASGAGTAGANQTERADHGGTWNRLLSSDENAATATTYTMSWTISGTDWAILAAAFKGVASGTDVTANAAVQAGTVSLQSPTVTTTRNVTITPAVQALTAAVQAPSITAQQHVTVSANPLTASFTLNSPTVVISQDALITPAAQALTLSLEAPTISTTQNVTVTTAAQTGTLALQPPTVAAIQSVVVTSATQVVTLSVESPSVSGEAIVNPSTQEFALTLQAPTVTTTRSVTISPSVQELTLTVPTPDIVTDAGVTVTPPSQDLTVTSNPPTVTAERHVTVAPAPLTLSLNLNSPTVATETSITVNPAVQEATLSATTPTVTTQQSATTTPNPLSLALTVNAPIVATGATLQAASFALTGSVVSPTVDARRNVVIAPATFQLTLTLLASFVILTSGLYQRRGQLQWQGRPV